MTFAIEVYTEALVPNFENSHIKPHKLSYKNTTSDHQDAGGDYVRS